MLLFKRKEGQNGHVDLRARTSPQVKMLRPSYGYASVNVAISKLKMYETITVLKASDTHWYGVLSFLLLSAADLRENFPPC